MSSRHDAFNRLVEFLQNHHRVFNAPYGILPSTMPGKYPGSVIYYTVTFGCSATMDATAYVFSENRVELMSNGRYTSLNRIYKSVDELIEALTGEFIEPF